jgi:acyl-coenzyme A synthetase/AMP-(fatty) acid ligase
MSLDNADNKVWLVGGGLPQPWSYARLAAAITGETMGDPMSGVAEMLLRLTRAIVKDTTVALGEPSWLGEGTFRERVTDSAELGADLEALRLALSQSREARVELKTSGSSGAPKSVTHRLETLSRAVVVSERHREDVWGLALNPAHMAGVQVYLQGLANLNSMVNLWGISRNDIIARCREWRVTHLSATPTFFRLLLPLEEPLSTVRSISIGGEAADARLLVRLRQAFPSARMHNIYASTEAGTFLSGDGLDFVVPDDRAHLMRIEGGQLRLHRSLLADSLRGDEWYDTGDLVEITGDSPLRVRIVGRVEGWINVGGEKVNPQEIESVLLAHEGVVAARVFGKKNSVTGNILAADLVARGNPPPETELREHLARQLPPQKIPRLIYFVPQLELTPSGKVKRC